MRDDRLQRDLENRLGLPLDHRSDLFSLGSLSSTFTESGQKNGSHRLPRSQSRCHGVQGRLAACHLQSSDHFRSCLADLVVLGGGLATAGFLSYHYYKLGQLGERGFWRRRSRLRLQ